MIDALLAIRALCWWLLAGAVLGFLSLALAGCIACRGAGKADSTLEGGGSRCTPSD